METSNKKKGVTVATVTTQKGKLIGTGISECSDKENYNSEVGRKLSLSRAIEGTNTKKEDRASLWEDFRTMKKDPKW